MGGAITGVPSAGDPPATETGEDLLELVDFAQAVAALDKAQADAEYAKWQAEREKLNYEKERLEHDYQLNGVYIFNKAVTPKSAGKLLRAIEIWHHHEPEAPWTIILNSVGGGIYAGLSIIDELIAHSVRGGGTHHITVKVRGVAASMGSMILQAGDHRVMGPNSMLMLHKGWGSVSGRTEDIEDQAEWFRQDTEAMVRFFLSRTNKITRAQLLRRINRRDWWIWPEEALRLGFVDEVG